MESFYKKFIIEELESVREESEHIYHDKDYEFYEKIYKGRDENEIVLKDIVFGRFKHKDMPVVVINFENELGYGDFEEAFMEQLLQKGIRVIFIKNSYYEDEDTELGFKQFGISYWKKNMVSMQLCYEYLKIHHYMKDISFVSINGLSATTINMIKYNQIKCNHIFLINGIIDYKEDEYPELKQLNPYQAFSKAKAEYKTYYSAWQQLDDPSININKSESVEEILDNILELI